MRGNVLSHRISDSVAERVVDRLEVVEVEQQYGKRMALAPAPPRRAAQPR